MNRGAEPTAPPQASDVVREESIAAADGPGRTRSPLGRLLSAGIDPNDDADSRFKKRLQTGMAWASLPAMGGLGVLLLFLQLPEAALFPFGYVVVTLGLLGHAAVTGRFEPFRTGHIGLVLVAPFSFHWYLGGFAASGGFFLWATIAPVAALMFLSKRASTIVFVVFLILTAVAAIPDGLHVTAVGPLPPWIVSILFVLNTLGFAGFVFISTRWYVLRLDQEKRRSEVLLLNVLPAPIAARLKRSEGVIADRFGAVTVLFSDIVGFTKLSARTSPEALVALLDELFSEFDALADRFGLEKIKTIGDAYMVVGGLPTPRPDHAQAVAEMGLAMVDVVRRFTERRGAEGTSLAVRVGIHTGEVVAGVIGRRKFSYDLWGDTVNTASRMESHGEAGRVQCSAATAARLSDTPGSPLATRPRGQIEVKGKGLLETFWVERAASAAAGAEAASGRRRIEVEGAR